MKCPACNRSMTPKNVGGVEVDVCEGGCGGIWFDDRELKKFDDQSDIDASPLLVQPKDVAVKVDPTAIRNCPRCTDEQVLCRRFYDTRRRVEIDQCLHCSGIFLDIGELPEIRAQFASDADRQAAGDRYLGGLLETTEDALQVDSQRRLQDWEEDVTFAGTVRNLFSGLLRS